MTHNEVLSCAMAIGENMLISGAEIYRVEDCISRICKAYGAVRTDVFTITSSIVLTVTFPDEETLTQTRRIDGYSTNLTRVDRLNHLSRQICCERPEFETFREQFLEAVNPREYSYLTQTLAFALIASSFTAFFGGSWIEALLSGCIGILLKATVSLTEFVNFNRVLSNLIASFVMSTIAFVCVKAGLVASVDMIVIGNIMLLIPGILLTNSIRDMISGDTIAGLLRFAEAIIFAIAIAGGYILASFVFGGGFR